MVSLTPEQFAHHRLSRNPLKEKQSDHVNAILAGAAFNLRKLMSFLTPLFNLEFLSKARFETSLLPYAPRLNTCCSAPTGKGQLFNSKNKLMDLTLPNFDVQ